MDTAGEDLSVGECSGETSKLSNLESEIERPTNGSK